MDQHNPFAAPQVALLDAQAPQPLPGWSAGQLRMLGWLNLGYLFAALVEIGLGFVEELSTLSGWLGVATTLLGSYLLLRLKAFLQARFAARGLDWPVWLSILSGVALELTQLYWGDSALQDFGVPMFTYFGLLVLLGLTLLWLGIMLQRVADAYMSLRVLAGLHMLGGVLAASIILLLVAVLPILAAIVATSLVFFRGAKEIEGSQAA